jgi:hypothetical protein
MGVRWALGIEEALEVEEGVLDGLGILKYLTELAATSIDLQLVSVRL